MRIRSSIQVRVLVATLVLSLAGLLLAVNSLRGALVERANAQALAVTSEALATLSRLTIDLSLERSLSQISIETPAAIGPEQREAIVTLRRKFTGDYQELMRQSDAVTTSARVSEFKSAIVGLRDQLTPLRRKLDQLNALPGSGRAADEVESLPREMKATVVSFQAQRHLLRGPGLMLPTEVGILETIRDQAWQIREFGGRERTYIAIAAATGASISASRLEEMAVLARRASDAWLDITRLALHEGLPVALKMSVHDVELGYYGRYERLRLDMIVEAHKVNPAYPANFGQFFRESSQALGGTEDLSLSASHAIEDYCIERARSTLVTVVGYALAAFLLAVVGMTCALMTINAFRRLYALRERMRTLAEGEVMADIPHTKMHDEVGAMARAVLVFRETAQKRVALEANATSARAEKDRRQAAAGQHTKRLTDGLAGIMRGLSTAARRMDAASGRMAQAAGSTGDLARVTTERAKSSASDLATVALATAQLTSSVNEISDQVARAAATSRGMAASAGATERTMTGLSDAAAQVSHVARLIGDIAGQTNLLALNATIEAARAGEAGRGFAVVAAEVKQLASRTTTATAEIASQIGSIQAATNDAVVAVRQMSAEVRQMEEMAAAIATAVEEQGTGVCEISTNIASVTLATEEAVQAMGEALASAEETRATSGEVRAVAGDVGRESDTLGRTVERFLVAMRQETGETTAMLHAA